MFKTIRVMCTAMLDLALPRTCVVCGRNLLLQEKHICTSCHAELPFTRFWESRVNPMADSFNNLINQPLPSGELPGYEPYSYAAALIYYNGADGYGNIPKRLKYNAALPEGRYFATMLGAKLAGSVLFADVDLVIPVPLHYIRRWRRGYNQAEVIAAEVARALGAALATNVLRRSRRTSSQARLGTSQKAANVMGAFTSRELPAGVRHILLVDDVFTTGSTLNACRVALRAVAGPAVRVSVATLAFARFA